MIIFKEEMKIIYRIIKIDMCNYNILIFEAIILEI